uniref:Uncharacterized protein n=1 Tax=Anguilla anguilla TaxID=7936 RepID=A0A0E9Q5U2_ANGAN
MCLSSYTGTRSHSSKQLQDV